MKAQLIDYNSVRVISDEQFERFVQVKAEKIIEESGEGAITPEQAREQALSDLKKIFKEFEFTPYIKDESQPFTSFIPHYIEKNGKVVNVWEVKENYDVVTMDAKIEQYEKQIAETDNKIVEYCEMLIMGKPYSEIPSEAKDLISQRSKLRKQITDIKELKNNIINDTETAESNSGE